MPKARVFPDSDNSPLIDDLVATFQSNLHMYDPTPIYALIGTMAANMVKGRPVWLMFVGPPSSGKTELLMSVTGISNVITLGQMKSSAALLTYSKKGQGDGGKLRQVGERGALIIKDFTNVISLSEDNKVEVTGALREVYDGLYEREVGNEGHQTLTWTGQIGMLAGVTNEIDSDAATSSGLGERWLYCRMDPSNDGTPEMNKASEVIDVQQAGNERKQAVEDLFEYVGMDWGKEIGEEDAAQLLSNKEHNRIMSLSSLTAQLRGVVKRDKYNKEIVRPATKESPTRIFVCLKKLLLGMRLIGIGHTAQWQVLRKIALDSTTELRMMTVKCVASLQRLGEDPMPDLLYDQIGVGVQVMRREMEDLEKLGILEKYRADDKTAWRLKPQYYKELTQ